MTAMPDPVFRTVLGADFDRLPVQIRAGHMIGAGLRMEGRARVMRGGALWPRLLAWVFGFPPAADDVAVVVTMRPEGGGELWERQFGDRRFQSYLKPDGGTMTETFGPLTFQLGLHVKDDQLFYPVRAARAGPLLLPRFMLPVSTAREFVRDGRFHFDVELRAPLTRQLMVHYQGWLAPCDPLPDP